jgi:L-threonylcarbamoyladenylate synthase
MEIISGNIKGSIERASMALKKGSLVAFPTETVYGLGADATNRKAVRRIYSVKGRPSNHPLIVHISSIKLLDKWAIQIPKYAMNLAEEFWPGPMTMILKRSSLAKDFITGKQDSVGIRVPSQSISVALLIEFEKLGGLGIAAPSANRFGAVSPTTSEAVIDELGPFLQKEDLVIDGGQCTIGIESSIIDCTKDDPTVLRPGAITAEMIENITGFKIQSEHTKNEIRAPGIHESHYSPKAKVEIGSTADMGDGLIALANIPTPLGVIRLASPKTIDDYARVFYTALRRGDHQGLKKITVVQPDGEGMAVAIRDRLVKAASIKDNSEKR